MKIYAYKMPGSLFSTLKSITPDITPDFLTGDGEKPEDNSDLNKTIDKSEDRRVATLEEYLKESVEIHKKLNPKLWDEEDELFPNIKKKLLLIADTFKEHLNDMEVPLDIEDIRIMGSNANYNYNKDSDLDLHIIADLSKDCEEGHLNKIYSIYRALFNSKYNISIKNISVEIYVEDKKTPSKYSGGIYSLKKGWIKKPRLEQIPPIDTDKIEKETMKLVGEIKKLIQRAGSNKVDNLIEDLDKFVDSLYDKRQKSMFEEGEFGFYNQVFKELRREGSLHQLKDLRVKLLNKNLSI